MPPVERIWSTFVHGYQSLVFVTPLALNAAEYLLVGAHHHIKAARFIGIIREGVLQGYLFAQTLLKVLSFP